MDIVFKPELIMLKINSFLQISLIILYAKKDHLGWEANIVNELVTESFDIN